MEEALWQQDLGKEIKWLVYGEESRYAGNNTG